MQRSTKAEVVPQPDGAGKPCESHRYGLERAKRLVEHKKMVMRMDSVTGLARARLVVPPSRHTVGRHRPGFFG